MDNVIIKEIREGSYKEREDQQLKRVINLMIVVDQTTQRDVEKCIRA
jgi:hypothetical protein